jgi:hypothetical protein
VTLDRAEHVATNSSQSSRPCRCTSRVRDYADFRLRALQGAM